jgi:hypothetical protein
MPLTIPTCIENYTIINSHIYLLIKSGLNPEMLFYVALHPKASRALISG